MNERQSLTKAVVELCQQHKEAELLQTIAEAYTELGHATFLNWFDDDITDAIAVTSDGDYDWFEVAVYGAKVAKKRAELWAGFKDMIVDAWRVMDMEEMRQDARDRLIERIELGEFDRSRMVSPGQLSLL